jgi:hypothetical protein
MIKRLLESLLNFNFTGVHIVLLEKLSIGESKQEIQTDDLQEAIQNQSKPVVKSRGMEIESNRSHNMSVDFIRIKLENYGEGVAQNLYVRPTLVVSYDPDPSEGPLIDIEDACFLTSDAEGFEIIPRYFPLTRTEGDPLKNNSREGGVLSSRDGCVEFSAQVEFEEVFYKEEGREEFVRSTVYETTQRLYDTGIRDISFQLHVLYTDVNDNVYAEQVMGKPGEITGGVTLEDIDGFRLSSESSDHKLHRRIEETYKYPP